MEIAEEQEPEEDYDELCAEILANWTSPSYSGSVHQNPFSMQDDEELDASSVVSNGLSTASPAKRALSWNSTETRISILPESEYDDFMDEAIELEKRGDRTTKSLHEKGESMATDQQIMPVLVTDTFYDKLLGCCVEGIDMAAMKKTKCDEDGGDFRIILKGKTNNGKEMGMLGSCQLSSGFKSNLPMLVSPSARENRGVPGKSNAAETEILCSKRGFIEKSRFVLPPRKTIFDINIDDLGEKNWRKPGGDTSDFFNYGLDEKQWKDYCKLMKAQLTLRRSGRSKTNADEGGRLHKEEALSGLKSNRGTRACLPIRPKDLNSHNSDVIIEIITDDSVYENDRRREHRMINGDKILPFPMDSHSHESREIVWGHGHNLEIEMKVKDLINFEEDLRRKERRMERFKVPLPILKIVVADKSSENETDTDSEIKYERPTRRRKWTSS